MAAFHVGTHCIVYCNSDDKWYDDGYVKKISAQYVNIIFKNYTKHKQMKLSSVSKYLVPINEQNLKLERGSHCFIHSSSLWCKGKVVDIYYDNKDQEWLKVHYKDENGINKIEDVRRHSAFINAIGDNINNAIGDDNNIGHGQMEKNVNIKTKQRQKSYNYTSPESTAEPEPIELISPDSM